MHLYQSSNRSNIAKKVCVVFKVQTLWREFPTRDLLSSYLRMRISSRTEVVVPFNELGNKGFMGFEPFVLECYSGIA